MIEPSLLKEYSKPLFLISTSLILGRALYLSYNSKIIPTISYIKSLLGLGDSKPHAPVKSTPSYTQKEFKKPVITPVPDDFDWTKEEPFPFRPFKNGQYKMTLAIRKADPSDFIVVEDTYLERTNIRARLFEDRHDKFSAFHESAIPALIETWEMIVEFFTHKYPKLFYIKEDEEGTKKFYNSIRDELLPATGENLSGTDLLRYINCTIEEDFLILIKNPEEGGLDEYYLRAGCSCFPAGFNPIIKFNKPLTAIHEPVPSYKEKLQTSMNKFFKRLSPYEFIVRNNWSIQSHTNLHAPTGSHQYRTDETVEVLDPDQLDFNKVFLRVEKQSFTRLPKSRADLMFIRTYITPMTKIRAEGRGADLIGAIDGLPTDLGLYKRRLAWGEAVKAYMRGDSNGCTDEIYKYEFTQ